MKTPTLPTIEFGKQWRAVLAELLATMLLIFFGCLACIPIEESTALNNLYGSLGFGLSAMFCIQIFGHISGAIMNPAVVIIAVIWKKMPVKMGVAYVIAESIGAIVGYGLLILLTTNEIATAGICVTMPHNLTKFQAMGIEIMLTMVLALVNCSILDPVNAHNTESVPIKFGLCITGLAVAGSALTGAGMNPVRSLGPAIWANKWDAHWVYWVGPILGGVLSGLLYKYIWLQPEEELKV